MRNQNKRSRFFHVIFLYFFSLSQKTIWETVLNMIFISILLGGFRGYFPVINFWLFPLALSSFFFHHLLSSWLYTNSNGRFSCWHVLLVTFHRVTFIKVFRFDNIKKKCQKSLISFVYFLDVPLNLILFPYKFVTPHSSLFLRKSHLFL